MEKNLVGVSHIRKLLLLIVALVILAFSCFGLSSCDDPVHWRYNLPRGYFIFYYDEFDIAIKDLSGNSMNHGCIISFCYNARYVCARTVDTSDVHTNGKSYEENYAELKAGRHEAPYLIFDVDTEDLYENLSKEEFDALCAELEITGLCDWIDTDTKPRRAQDVSS
ncbi:MAG: hypothetical protein IJX02_03845 [Clostridia bacterium]|nr:hypothetical protein [Clostridia bacterium]